MLNKNNGKSLKNILNELHVDDSQIELTKARPKSKVYNKFVNSIVPEPKFNYMVDLLHLPKTKAGYKYLFVIMDIATNKFDIEQMKTTNSEESVEALNKITKRGILTLPDISIKSDGGSEFKGAFDKYLQEQLIYHSTATADRKTQMSPVERLNRTLGKLIMNYLSSQETKLKRPFNEWVSILPTIRKELNEYRERDLDKIRKVQEESYFDLSKAKKSQFEIGDVVRYILLKPKDVHGNKINDTKFREGDRRWSVDTRTIDNIIYYPDAPYYRYKLKHMPHISYASNELKLVENGNTTYEVKALIGKKQMKKQMHYLVWYKGYKKSESTYEKESDLREDGLGDMIDEYSRSTKNKEK